MDGFEHFGSLLSPSPRFLTGFSSHFEPMTHSLFIPDDTALIIEGDRVLLDAKNRVLSVEKDGVVIWSDEIRPGDFVESVAVETVEGFVRVAERVRRTQP